MRTGGLLAGAPSSVHLESVAVPGLVRTGALALEGVTATYRLAPRGQRLRRAPG